MTDDTLTMHSQFDDLQTTVLNRTVHASDLETAIAAARNQFYKQQDAKGFWCFELEADSTIPAEYILMMHYMGETDPEMQVKLAAYLREQQAEHDGWPLYYGGEFDMSCSVKAYYALKLAGDSPTQPHMRRARAAILSRGGAARSNVFTLIALALFEQIPWRGVPFIPVEVLLFPRWFPFHLSKVSYWSRTVMVPLLILCSLKPKAKNPQGTHIRELFTIPPEQERHYFPIRSKLNRVFITLDSVGKTVIEPLIPKWIRRKAVNKAEAWFTERLNGEDGLGAIFPAMVNAFEALAVLGYANDHPHMVQARDALKHLLTARGEQQAYCQPCFSPVWDTCLGALALLEEADNHTPLAITKALDWLCNEQLLDAPGDWREARPNLKGGGWAFQYKNDYYPDLDDTAAVAWAMHRANQPERYAESITRAADWLRGMQSKNGGFASFELDNTQYYLNEIPFADHGALLDPPTVDVSARCVTLFARLKREEDRTALRRCIDYLYSEQEENGSWFGRWGTNYIYGTWSVLAALEQAGESMTQPCIRKAVTWLKCTQNADGGWGEDNGSYFEPAVGQSPHPSTPFQTAWALLALMAAGEVNSPEVTQGINYLIQQQDSDGLWSGPWFTAPGFPRVFYLKYHGYYKYFTLWALARYRNLTAQSSSGEAV